MNNSKVESVVAVSVYSGDNLPNVVKSLSSVILDNQFSRCLCIVLDGVVNDDIVKYVNELVASHSHCLVLANSCNRGLAYSMNKVVDYFVENDFGGVKYFFRMDADDICIPGRFEKQIAYMEQHQLDVVGANCIEINGVDQQIGVRSMPEYHEDIVSIMPRRCVINHPTALIRFDIFRSGFRYNPKLMNTQDYYLWADLLAAGYRFGNVQEPLLYFRRDVNFLSRRGKKKAVNDVKARFNMMRKLGRFSLFNVIYAISFFCARMMPLPILRVLYLLNTYINKKTSGGRRV